MINEMAWLPKWTTPVKIEAGGRHPLGLNRFHNHLEDLLIKSIVWLAESLPHFTYSCWAIGDIATYPYHGPGGNGKPIRIEHWNVAQNMGRAVGQKIADPSAKPHPFVPIFWSALGSQLRYCGSTPNGFDDVIVTGEPDADQPKFVAYYAKGDDIVAVASMMKDPAMTKAAELMRLGKMYSKSDIEGGKDVLQVSL